jgi:hypothetical protein
MSEVGFVALTDHEAMRRAQIERDIDDGKYDNEYWEFVVDRGAGQIMLHEEAIYEAIESGDWFEQFVDHLMEQK